MMLMMFSTEMGTQQVPWLPSLSSQLLVSRSLVVAPIQLATSLHLPSSPAWVKHRESPSVSTLSSWLVWLELLRAGWSWGQADWQWSQWPPPATCLPCSQSSPHQPGPGLLRGVQTPASLGYKEPAGALSKAPRGVFACSSLVLYDIRKLA